MSCIDFTRFCPRVYSGDGTMEGDTHDNIERMTMKVGQLLTPTWTVRLMPRQTMTKLTSLKLF